MLSLRSSLIGVILVVHLLLLNVNGFPFSRKKNIDRVEASEAPPSARLGESIEDPYSTINDNGLKRIEDFNGDNYQGSVVDSSDAHESPYSGGIAPGRRYTGGGYGRDSRPVGPISYDGGYGRPMEGSGQNTETGRNRRPVGPIHGGNPVSRPIGDRDDMPLFDDEDWNDGNKNGHGSHRDNSGSPNTNYGNPNELMNGQLRPSSMNQQDQGGQQGDVPQRPPQQAPTSNGLMGSSPMGQPPPMGQSPPMGQQTPYNTNGYNTNGGIPSQGPTSSNNGDTNSGMGGYGMVLMNGAINTFGELMNNLFTGRRCIDCPVYDLVCMSFCTA